MSPTPPSGEFDLKRLLTTVFRPQQGEKVGVFIDLDDPNWVREFAFLREPGHEIQRLAYEIFYRELRDNAAAYPFGGVSFFAYEKTGGSNLDLPPVVYTPDKRELALQKVLYGLDIVLYITTYSATAPLTALARRLAFRGATMHGLNEIILRSGLTRDYEEVSAQAERLRQALTEADSYDIEFDVSGRPCRLHLELGGQEAQKSHGLCWTTGEIANLPAGEIYYVPTDAAGEFPMVYEGGTVGIAHVHRNRIGRIELLAGEARVIAAHAARLADDPVIGELGELGLGTQVLPWSGRDIQDEKVLGTVHVATGRSDHLGGSLSPDKFKSPLNASHDDILFAPHKTPQVDLVRVTMRKQGRETVLIEHYQPTAFVKQTMGLS